MIYLDNAATSFPKPPEVVRAVTGFFERAGACPGRGAYAMARHAGELVDGTRRLLARLLHAPLPERIVFTLNATDALNMAIKGTLAKGDHVVTTVIEHHSVGRPLAALEREGRIRVTRVPVSGEGFVDPADIERAITPATRLVAVMHASNVTGALQPAAVVGRIAREHSAVFLLDAAQTLGDLPLSVDDLAVDLLAAPGHKGLLGPLGTGILYIRRGVEDRLAPLRQGGTGSFSDEDRQPETLPDRYESGNLNVPGILGLAAGVGWLQVQGVDDVRRHAIELTERLLAGLSAIAGLRIHGPATAAERVGVALERADASGVQPVGGPGAVAKSLLLLDSQHYHRVHLCHLRDIVGASPLSLGSILT